MQEEYLTPHERKLWLTMLGRSFSPRQWFEEPLISSEDDRLRLDGEYQEQKPMYVYLANNSGGWDVGFYSPLDRAWCIESTFLSKEEAARRVHWINGGNEA